MSIEQRVKAEVEDLHRFFEGWLAGTLPARSLRRVEEALTPGFTFVGPSGLEMDRDALLSMLRSGYGSREGLRLWVEGTRLELSRSGIILARYEELQERAGQRTRRVTTAVLEDAGEEAGVPYGLRWLRVHETWMTEEGESGRD